MISRPASWVAVSNTWVAKKTSAVSMTAKIIMKNGAAIIANSTAAEPLRSLRNRLRTQAAAMLSMRRVRIFQMSRWQENVTAENYAPEIVEVFRTIVTIGTAPLTFY